MFKAQRNTYKFVSMLFLLLITYFYTQFSQSNEPEVLPATTTPTPIYKDLYLVTRVIDGDTIVVNINDQNQTVRLIGVDTPESVDPRRKVECFGRESAAKLKELLENKNIILLSDDSQGDKDRYNRLLRYVYLTDGTFINKTIIEEGYGFEYTYSAPYLHQTELKESQAKARQLQSGLWNPSVCPPKK